jgi:hypothetical protein
MTPYEIPAVVDANPVLASKAPRQGIWAIRWIGMQVAAMLRLLCLLGCHQSCCASEAIVRFRSTGASRTRKANRNAAKNASTLIPSVNPGASLRVHATRPSCTGNMNGRASG